MPPPPPPSSLEIRLFLLFVPRELTGRPLAVQGWSSVIPNFSIADFFSFYIELPVMALMYFLWLLVRRVRHAAPPTTPPPLVTRTAQQPFFDFVDVTRVDLYPR
jgi:AAT family amino acid transporter